MTWSNPRYITELLYFSVWVFETPNKRAIIMMKERVSKSISRSIFNPTRTGNGFNKIMSTGNGFNKVIMYIIPSRQKSEILFEATRTCVWLELDVCSMCVRFATQQRDTSGLINHQVQYFAKANSAFTIFLHRKHGRFIVYQFKTVSLFSNWDSKVTKHIPSSSSSSSSVMSPSSTTRLNRAEWSNWKSLPLPPLTAATQHHTKMCHWIIHHLRTFPTE